MILTEGKGLFENNDLPFDLNKLPGVFSSFRRKVEKNLKIRPLIVVPEKILLYMDPEKSTAHTSAFWTDKFQADERAVLDFGGGEDAGASWMKEWIRGKGLSKIL